jgi:S-adenosylmethionine synthetase
MTKYEMTEVIAKHLNLPITHIIANTQPATGQAAAQRPENSQLSTKKLEEIGVDTSESESFDAWWKRYAQDVKA